MSKKKNRKNNYISANETVDEAVVETSEEVSEATEESEAAEIETAEESEVVKEEEATEEAEVVEEEEATKGSEVVNEEAAEEEPKETEALKETEEVSKKKRPVDKKELQAAKAASDEAKRERTEDSAKAKARDAKRAARRKRRIRNQIISYVTVLLLLAVIVFAGLSIIKTIKKHVNVNLPAVTKEDVEEFMTPPEQTGDAIDNSALLEEIFGGEEEIVEPDTPNDAGTEPEVVEEPVEEMDALDYYVRDIISEMTIEQKVAGLFLTTPESITGVDLATMAGAGTQTALSTYQVGGIVYSQQNIVEMTQFSSMISNTNGMLAAPTFLAVAEEGGVTSPLANIGYYEAQLSAAELGATFDTEQVYNAGTVIGSTMASIGLNLNLAPVADLSDVAGNILGDRTFGSKAVDTAELVKAMVQAYEDQGITACLKYFPGLGTATSDPKYGRVVVDKSADYYRSADFLVYQAAIDNGVKMIQVGNIVVSDFDEEYPTSLSSTIVTDILRGELGYKGVILSGNLSDLAVTEYYDSKTAAIYALRAGCDMLYCPENFVEAYNGIIEAVADGTIDEDRIDDALARIYRIKYDGAVAIQ